MSVPSPPREPSARLDGMKRWLRSWRGPWRRRDLVLLGLCPLLLVASALLSERVTLQGHVLGGVLLDGEPVSGWSPDALRERLEEKSQELSARSIAIGLRDAVLPLQARDLDARLEIEGLVAELLRLGREGSWLRQLVWRFERMLEPVAITPRVVFDEVRWEAQLAAWEQALLTTPHEAELIYEKGELRRVEPVPGDRIQRAQASAELRRVLASPEVSALSLVLVAEQPRTTRAALDAAEAEARAILKAPIRLRLERPEGVEDESASEAALGDVVFRPQELGPAIRTRVVPEPAGSEPAASGAGIEVTLDPEVLDRLLAPVRARHEQPPRDAVFDVDSKGRISIRPSRVQIRLPTEAVALELLRVAKLEPREGVLALVAGEHPRIPTELAHTLNINRLVSQFTTRHPCCQPRVGNIHRIADRIDGVVVLPGETFSVNAHVGPRTPSKGFVPAPTIVLGEMNDTFGGGISQFATTLFNAVLDAGYVIVERQPHSYYFPRYPEGHEATLSYPKPDLVFTNDTRSGLLIKTEYTGTYIRVKLYGDTEGRQVHREVSPRFDFVDPAIQYEVDDTLAPDAAVVREAGSKGFSVNALRRITNADGQVTDESRKVIYQPRTRVVAVHSCRVPEGEPGYTGEPCPEPELGDAGAPLE